MQAVRIVTGPALQQAGQKAMYWEQLLIQKGRQWTVLVLNFDKKSEVHTYALLKERGNYLDNAYQALRRGPQAVELLRAGQRVMYWERPSIQKAHL